MSDTVKLTVFYPAQQFEVEISKADWDADLGEGDDLGDPVAETVRCTLIAEGAPRPTFEAYVNDVKVED